MIPEKNGDQSREGQDSLRDRLKRMNENFDFDGWLDGLPDDLHMELERLYTDLKNTLQQSLQRPQDRLLDSARGQCSGLQKVVSQWEEGGEIEFDKAQEIIGYLGSVKKWLDDFAQQNIPTANVRF